MTELGRRNYGGIVAYDGTEYYGFQSQPDRPTIQGQLAKALTRLTQQCVQVVGAGRTDAGVHAVGQVISFRCEWRHPVAELERGLNALLPRDISAWGLRAVDDGFHARYSARQRTYLYSIYTGARRQPLLGRFAAHVAEPLDMAAMQAAADFVVGRQDLAALGQPPSGRSTVREVTEAHWMALGLGWGGDQAGLGFRVSANGFLRGMVRRLVGSLLEVGRGRWSVDQFADLLISRDIGQAAAPAPACGLCLQQVDYNDDIPPEADAMGLKRETLR